MLLHIRPRLFSHFRNVDLLEMDMPELGLCLTGRVDLVTRRPYPNKGYAVACRKHGRKTVDGIFIETKEALDEFHVSARWAIEAERIVSHNVHYKLLDHDFDAASDDMMLWHAQCEELGGWPSRKPTWCTKEIAPVLVEPFMEVVAGRPRAQTVDEENGGMIVARWQSFEMPTLERERVLGNRWHDRMPSIDAAFHARAVHRLARCHNPVRSFVQ
jgi:hypothetical protein